jgi:hypothetical protein
MLIYPQLSGNIGVSDNNIKTSMNIQNDLKSILLNILGGVLVILLDRLYLFLSRKLKDHNFKKIFGQDVNKEFNLIYTKFQLANLYNYDGTSASFPYIKHSIFQGFNIQNPISESETKSSKYLSEVISKFSTKFPKLVSDEEEIIKTKLDFSFCAFGSGNIKTSEILDSEENKFVFFNTVLIRTKEENPTEYRITGKNDYGLILKIKNKNFPTRVQICLLGLGEFGTSGASWFLSHKWKDLVRKVGNEAFCAIIKVKHGIDESAEIEKIMK